MERERTLEFLCSWRKPDHIRSAGSATTLVANGTCGSRVSDPAALPLSRLNYFPAPRAPITLGEDTLGGSGRPLSLLALYPKLGVSFGSTLDNVSAPCTTNDTVPPRGAAAHLDVLRLTWELVFRGDRTAKVVRTAASTLGEPGGQHRVDVGCAAGDQHLRVAAGVGRPRRRRRTRPGTSGHPAPPGAAGARPADPSRGMLTIRLPLGRQLPAEVLARLARPAFRMKPTTGPHRPRSQPSETSEPGVIRAAGVPTRANTHHQLANSDVARSRLQHSRIRVRATERLTYPVARPARTTGGRAAASGSLHGSGVSSVVSSCLSVAEVGRPGTVTGSPVAPSPSTPARSRTSRPS